MQICIKKYESQEGIIPRRSELILFMINFRRCELAAIE
jgi:hypothetical protein